MKAQRGRGRLRATCVLMRNSLPGPGYHLSRVSCRSNVRAADYLKEMVMPAVTVKDGSHIFYKDWGSGQPVVFSHGWPLNADTWDVQANLVASRGFRAIAHDRRGHGRSTQTWHGNDMDTYASDLAEVIESLRLNDVILVGHSIGGGEITRYMGCYGTARVSKPRSTGRILDGCWTESAAG